MELNIGAITIPAYHKYHNVLLSNLTMIHGRPKNQKSKRKIANNILVTKLNQYNQFFSIFKFLNIIKF